MQADGIAGESSKELATLIRKSVKPVNNTALPPNYRKSVVRVLVKELYKQLGVSEMKVNPALFVPLILLACLFIPTTAGQDQLQAPSWELGWETDMGGTYDLMMNEEDKIADVVEFYIRNQRMTEINIDITVDWDESENIPIKLDYDESVVVAASDTIILAISISDDSGYSYQRSPSDAMTLKITASEAAFEQSVSEQETEENSQFPRFLI